MRAGTRPASTSRSGSATRRIRGAVVSLLRIDPVTRESATDGPSLLANPALPGFSLSDGHLAWATPPDATGSGSRLQVFAWAGPDAGKIASQPAGATDTVIVVQH
jgi:hypothetical protein